LSKQTSISDTSLLLQTIEELSLRFNKLETKVTELRAENKQLRKENKELKKENKTLNQENRILRQENELLKERVASWNTRKIVPIAVCLLLVIYKSLNELKVYENHQERK